MPHAAGALANAIHLPPSGAFREMGWMGTAAACHTNEPLCSSTLGAEVNAAHIGVLGCRV
eukprot:301252-Chlamydomonas_euryale.AAC.1